MSWDITGIEEWNWRKHPAGSVIRDPGNSRNFKTGSWRSQRPVRDVEKCNDCLICFVYCPDSAILTEEGKMLGVNLDFCKGCGICAYECPQKAIVMKNEIEEAAKKTG
jgi:pyruvate ferredoxin oxidoreductase delta subunit